MLHAERLLTQVVVTSSTLETNINRDEEHRLADVEPRDLPTVLLLKFASVQDDHFGGYDKQGDKV